MRTIVALLALSSMAFADADEDMRMAMAMERERHQHKESKVELPVPVEKNIFAGYSEARLREILQPQPVRQAVRPNQGSCVCNRTGGDCLCQPASLCAQGKCPALTQLRSTEIQYYFPNPTYCPPGRP